MAEQLLRVATEGVFGSFPIDDCVQSWKCLSDELHPSVISLIDFLDIKEMTYDYSYDLAAVIMALGTIKAVNWLAVSSILQRSGLFMTLVEEMCLCSLLLETFV